MIESWDLTHRSQPVCGDVHLIVVSFQAWTQYCVEPEQVDKWVENLRKVRIVYVNNISSTTVTTVIVIAVIIRNYLFFLSHKSTASKKFNRVQRFLWRCWLTQGYVEQNHSSSCLHVQLQHILYRLRSPGSCINRSLVLLPRILLMTVIFCLTLVIVR